MNMWSALVNGAGLHGGGGGGAGGGYVPSQGWEFVPCPRMAGADRGRGTSRSPLRRISSPPTVFSQLHELQRGGEGTETEILRGQMWEPQQQQQQTNHVRLKKKFGDLKKRHDQDKEEWMREKELLLREVADIQGGENKRILLDLKKVLEEVQAEVKREEEKRSELQLQYTRDRCAWQLEKAELKCRIAQLETRDGSGLQSAAGPGSEASRHGETPSLCRDGEEQRRLLADTHSSAMDLRCRLEHSERGWLKEKAELLERFDGERREWESQLKDMQKKIEELYCEVRAKREGTGLGGGRPDYRLSTRSSSTGSSLLSDNSRSEPLSSCSPSEPSRPPPLPGLGHNRTITGGADAHRSSCFHADGVVDLNAGARFAHSQPELRAGLRSKGGVGTDAGDTTVFDAGFCGAPQTRVSAGNENSVHLGREEDSVWSELSYDSDKKKSTTALNAALKEIARVSEELCSYQDEIRQKSGDKRDRSESLCQPGERQMLLVRDATRLEEEADLSQIYDDLRALETENWITLSPSSTWSANKTQNTSWRASVADTQTIPGELSDVDAVGPPVPPRSSSWNLSAQSHPETELHILESPVTTVRKCHSPCVLVDRKCSSPSIVRKFEAMLQENEGKVFVDGIVTSCSAPANAKCSTGCCHNRWSCDTSKFSSSKLSAYGTVQKSFSEVNIRSAGKDLPSEHNAGVKSPQLQMPLGEFPRDSLVSSAEVPPVNPSLQGSRRNITLEQKTAEFNRTLFQAEMGRGVEEPEILIVTDASRVGGQPDEHYPTRESTFQANLSKVTPDITHVDPETTVSPEVQPRGMRRCPEGQEVIVKHELEQPQVNLKETAARSAAPTNKVQRASSPSRKTQPRAATEDLFPVESGNAHGAKPEPARVSVSGQQPCAESKDRQMSQPGPKSDSFRPGPRMMNDHPWKPLTLAAYPRPEGSRSNYGALERILKNYESVARAQQTQGQKNEAASNPNLGVGQEEKAADVDVLDMDPLTSPPKPRHTQSSHTSQIHSTQLSSSSALTVTAMQLVVQESDRSPPFKRSFSRPARPSNRRLPSRWASRSPPPPSTPVTPPSVPLHRRPSAFCYSHGFHMETVII